MNFARNSTAIFIELEDILFIQSLKAEIWSILIIKEANFTLEKVTLLLFLLHIA